MSTSFLLLSEYSISSSSSSYCSIRDCVRLLKADSSQLDSLPQVESTQYVFVFTSAYFTTHATICNPVHALPLPHPLPHPAPPLPHPLPRPLPHPLPHPQLTYWPCRLTSLHSAQTSLTQWSCCSHRTARLQVGEREREESLLVVCAVCVTVLPALP